MLVVGVCVSKYVNMLIRFELGSHWVWGGCVLGGVGGWVSEFWISNIVFMLILTKSRSAVCLTQFGQKEDLVSFGKTLFKYITY